MSRAPESRWGRREAEWYAEGLAFSDYPEKVAGVIRPLVRGLASLLDVGAGTGALSLALADSIGHIVALDASPAMLAELRLQAQAADIHNIEPVEGKWEEREEALGVFDATICANVPHLLSDMPRIAPLLEKHTRCYVFLISGTPKNRDRFYLRELWPLLHRRKYPPKPDYFSICRALYKLNIYSNIAIVDYSFDQPFVDIEEALLFWKHHLRLRGKGHDAVLREFLSKRLEPWAGRLWASVPKQSAIMWWQPVGGR